MLFIGYQPVLQSVEGLMQEAVGSLAGMDLNRIQQQQHGYWEGDLAPQLHQLPKFTVSGIEVFPLSSCAAV